MRNFVCIADWAHRGRNLNMHQLLNPIFYQVDKRHPDMKRQRSRRQRSRDLSAARRLKTQCSTWVPELPDTEHAEWKMISFAARYGINVELSDMLKRRTHGDH